MKINQLPLMTLAALVVAISLSACGKTTRDTTSTDTSVSTSGVNSCCTTMTSTFTNTSTSTSTNTVITDPPLSFEFVLNGNQSAITPSFSTDNVLKVKFIPGVTQGNSFHSASELAVTLQFNSIQFTPQYTSNNYTYGQVSENSNVIDMSGYIQPGAGVQIQVLNPKSDYYCTYAPNPFYYFDGTQYVPVNPLYNSYPGLSLIHI